MNTPYREPNPREPTTDPVQAMGVKRLKTMFSIDVCVYDSYNDRESRRMESRPVTAVEWAGRELWLIPFGVYETGDIAEMWGFAGEPRQRMVELAGLASPETLLGLRDGRWVFLLKRPEGAKKWPTRSAAEVVKSVAYLKETIDDPKSTP